LSNDYVARSNASQQNKTMNATLIYNPVVRNGLFETTAYGLTQRVRACDASEAKFKHAAKLGLPYKPSEIGCKVIEPTKRRNG
jgi:hypothetical protein